MPPLPKDKSQRANKPTKKSAPKAPRKEKHGSLVKEEPVSTIPLELQQLLLNIFRDSFAERLQSDIKPLLQEVKGHLFNRDFATAFGKKEYLEAYAARWSPSRALGYLQIFESLRHVIVPFVNRDEVKGDSRKGKIVCLGGGAGAEIVALAGCMKMVKRWGEEEEKNDEEILKALEIMSIDIAAWDPVVDKLSHAIVSKPPLSAYASQATKDANRALLEDSAIGNFFHQHDILTTPFPSLSPLLETADLVTLMFTLNELYSTSVSQTQSFLLNLTRCLEPGAMLLVVDSPGSYSTISLNGAEKKYPMHFLLDHTLLGKGSKEEGLKGWEKVVEDESRWFRVREELRYPIEVENMRVQIHLYRRV
jgi:25S rRNA (uracil2843-N3)-methyltransferase